MRPNASRRQQSYGQHVQGNAASEADAGDVEQDTAMASSTPPRSSRPHSDRKTLSDLPKAVEVVNDKEHPRPDDAGDSGNTGPHW